MRLKSSFSDYYDPWFDAEGPLFRRLGGNVGPAKREQFRLLEAAGFNVPLHGRVGDLTQAYLETEKCRVKHVVAYLDENAHCTEGKKLYGCWQLQSNPHMGMPGGDRY